MILLVGRSGSGKDTNALGNKYDMVVSHTTRRPRPGEVDGVKYHFHAADTPFPDDAIIIAKTIKNGFKYWVTIEDLYTPGGWMRDCFIIDYVGVKYLKTRYSDKEFASLFTVVFLDCPYPILYRNLRHNRKESLWFVVRRMVEDVFAFAGAASAAQVIIRYKDGYIPDLRPLDS